MEILPDRNPMQSWKFPWSNRSLVLVMPLLNKPQIKLEIETLKRAKEK